MPKKTFVMSDESLNSYGFRVLTSGIDLSDFSKNPLAFYNHNTYDLPIGKWENIRIEKGQLLGDFVPDERDEEAMEIWNKIEGGFLNACSIGIKTVECSADPKFLMPGQTYETVTKSQLRECSIVNIPSNKNALRLYDESEMIMLSASASDLSPILPKIIELKTIESIENDMNKLKNYLELGENANEDDVLKILTEKDKSLKELNEKLSKLEAEKIATEILTLCEKKGVAKVDAEKYVKLAEKDLETVKHILSAMSDYVPASTQLNTGKASGILAKLEERKEWSFSDWQKKDDKGLLELKNNFQAEYEELKKTLKTK